MIPRTAVIFAIILSILVTTCHCAPKKKKLKDLKCGNILEMDQILAKLYTYGNSGRKFPTSFSGFKAYCNETLSLTVQFESYIKSCVENSFTRSMLSVLINTIRRESRVQCKKTADGRPTKKQEKLIAAASCSNVVQGAHAKCINRAIYFVTDSIAIRENKRKLAFICCNVAAMEECLYDAMAKEGAPFCSEEKAQTSIDFLNSVQGNLMNVLCAEFSPESDVCNRYKGISPVTKKSPYRSFTLPFIESLATVGDDDI